MSDIEIARKANKKNIKEIASKLKLDENDLHPCVFFILLKSILIKLQKKRKI